MFTNIAKNSLKPNQLSVFGPLGLTKRGVHKGSDSNQRCLKNLNKIEGDSAKALVLRQTGVSQQKNSLNPALLLALVMTLCWSTQEAAAEETDKKFVENDKKSFWLSLVIFLGISGVGIYGEMQRGNLHMRPMWAPRVVAISAVLTVVINKLASISS